ncbi:MAG: EscU/YscU/HrcU family type III secretion system export apparatus switch protein [Gammaproteobacteria bacterium]|jgi:flagellar biosynthesis protein
MNRKSSAIGLHYNGETAPTVSVAGIGPVAEKIIACALEQEVPIYENIDLLETLASLDIGQEIPEELYIIIAQIIAFVYHLKGLTPHIDTIHRTD